MIDPPNFPRPGPIAPGRRYHCLRCDYYWYPRIHHDGTIRAPTCCPRRTHHCSYWWVPRGVLKRGPKGPMGPRKKKPLAV